MNNNEIMAMCYKIINNMQIKNDSIKKDLIALTNIVQKIKESFQSNIDEIDPNDKNIIADSLLNILDGNEELLTYMSDLDPEFELLKNNMNNILDICVGG